MKRLRGQRGQTTTEYMLAISVLVVGISAAFYTLIGTTNEPGPIAKSFTNQRHMVEAPYP
jgi:hypothetical protein